MGARGSAVNNTPHPPARPQCAPSGAGAREGRGWRVSSRSFSHPHPRSQPSPQAQREKPHPPVGGLDLNPQQSSSAPNPSRYIRVSGRGQPQGVPNTAGMLPGCWWGDPGLIPWPALGPVQIRILTPQRPGAHPRLTPRTSRAWWGLRPHLHRRSLTHHSASGTDCAVHEGAWMHRLWASAAGSGCGSAETREAATSAQRLSPNLWPQREGAHPKHPLLHH